MRVEETVDAKNGTNSAVKNVIAGSGAVAVDSVPKPSVVTGTATGFTTGVIVGADVSSAKNADGSSANAVTDVEYVLYYAVSPTALTAGQIKAASKKSGNTNTAGEASITVGHPVTVTVKRFIADTTVYIIVEARIKNDSTKTTLSSVASYPVPNPLETAFEGIAKLYKKGDKIQVTVKYATAVIVTGTPKIVIKIGMADKDALYVRSSSSSSTATTLVFAYTVVEGDTDTNGIEIKADSLEPQWGNHRGQSRQYSSFKP